MMVNKLCTSIMLLLAISAAACGNATKTTDEVSVAVAAPEPPQASDANELGIKKSPPGKNVYADLACKRKELLGKALCTPGRPGVILAKMSPYPYDEFARYNNIQGFGPNSPSDPKKLYVILVPKT